MGGGVFVLECRLFYRLAWQHQQQTASSGLTERIGSLPIASVSKSRKRGIFVTPPTASTVPIWEAFTPDFCRASFVNATEDEPRSATKIFCACFFFPNGFFFFWV